MAFNLSNDFRFGLLKQVSKSGNADNHWAVAAEYFYSPKSWFKGRLTSLGVFALFNRTLLNDNFILESYLETGLDRNHRIQGIAGSNIFAGMKIIYNE